MKKSPIQNIKEQIVNRISERALEAWNGSRELENEIVIIAQRQGIEKAIAELEAYSSEELSEPKN